MAYKKLLDVSNLNDRQLAELQIQILERTRRNTGAIADMIGTIIFLSILGAVLTVMGMR